MDEIEIVVVRDPDAGTGVQVFLAGKEVTADKAVTVTVIDPGSGWSREDWNQAREDAVTGASPAAAAALAEGYDGFADSQFISDEEW